MKRNLNHGKYFLSFKATCKDAGCELFGWSEKKSRICEALEVNILAEVTRGNMEANFSKRPLRGTKRDVVNEELLKDVESNWWNNATSNMEFGQFSPPN